MAGVGQEGRGNGRPQHGFMGVGREASEAATMPVRRPPKVGATKGTERQIRGLPGAVRAGHVRIIPSWRRRR